MAESLLPEQINVLIADMDRRLRALESAPRNGLSTIRLAFTTGATYSPSVFGSYETGGSNTWQDDTGATGTGYPQVTMTVGSKVLFFMSCFIVGIATGGTFRSNLVSVGVADSPNNPGDWTNPRMYRQFLNTNSGEIRVPVTMSVMRTNITPGTHTFNIQANWNDTAPAGTTLPRMAEAVLMVVPINV